MAGSSILSRGVVALQFAVTLAACDAPTGIVGIEELPDADTMTSGCSGLTAPGAWERIGPVPSLQPNALTMAYDPHVDTPSNRAGRSRRELAAYLVLVIVGTTLVQLRIYQTHLPIEKAGSLVFLLMWTPGIASVIVRLALRTGFRDISIRWGGWSGSREALRAWVYPLLVGGIAYAIAWSTGLAHFSARPFQMAMLLRSEWTIRRTTRDEAEPIAPWLW